MRKRIAAVRKAGPRVGRDVLNATAFSIRKRELPQEVQRSFDFAGPSTKRFVGGPGAWLVRQATTGRLRATIFTSPKSRTILEEHALGKRAIARRDPNRLTVKTPLGKRYAVPVDVSRYGGGGKGIRRGKRGKIRASQLPGAILKSKTRFAFINRNATAILRRQGKRHLRVVYALTPAFTLGRRINFGRAIRVGAKRHLPRHAKNKLERVSLR